MSTTDVVMLDAALEYAAAGWPVFPVHEPNGRGCSCGVSDCPSPAKHPRTTHGFHDATTDEERIRGWWSRWPLANIGTALGNGRVVVDADTYKDGGAAFDELISEYGHPPDTVETITGSGGRHLWFSGDEPKGRLAASVDFQGAGSYVVVPPSRHMSGRRYEWEDSHDWREPMAPITDWLKTAPQKFRPRATDRVSYKMPEQVPIGDRKRYAVSVAGTMKNRGMSQAATLAGLRAEFDRFAQEPGHPFTDDDVVRIVDYVFDKERSKAPAAEPSGDLASVRGVYSKHLVIPDTAVIDVSLASVVAHRMGGESFWPLFVSAPSGGKTEVIQSLSGLPEVFQLSKLTAQTFVSGMKGRESMSLLKRLEERGQSIITLKDFTTVLTLHRDARAEILSQLREIYDGSYVATWGSGREVTWEGRLGFLAGVTPVIDTMHAVTSVLGERFTYLRLTQPSRVNAGKAALDHDSLGAMRAEFRDAVSGFLEQHRAPSRIVLDDSERDWLVGLADLVTYVRSAVQRDGFSHDILITPEPELPTRFVQQIGQLYRALQVIGHEDPRALTRRVARDSAPGDRMRAIGLLEERGEMATPELVDLLGLPKTTTTRIFEDLHALGLVYRDAGQGGRGKAHRWGLTDLTVRLLGGAE